MPHQHVEGWGMFPVLCRVGGHDVPTYSVMILLALLTGGIIYWLRARKAKEKGDKAFLIPLAALIGGVLGAKIPVWFEMIYLTETPPAASHGLSALLSGRTIVGGLIGGTIAVMLMKRFLGTTARRGNLFAPAVALGLAVGRLGCFMGGCCYGVPTSTFPGMDFGDGVLRHPTQLYEATFALAMFFFLLAYEKRKTTLAPGKLFDIFLNGYFCFRFLIEFIRVEPVVWMGLSMYQLLCIAALLFVNRHMLLNLIKKKVKT